VGGGVLDLFRIVRRAAGAVQLLEPLPVRSDSLRKERLGDPPCRSMQLLGVELIGTLPDIAVDDVGIRIDVPSVGGHEVVKPDEHHRKALVVEVFAKSFRDHLKEATHFVLLEMLVRRAVPIENRMLTAATEGTRCRPRHRF